MVVVPTKIGMSGRYHPPLRYSVPLQDAGAGLADSFAPDNAHWAIRRALIDGVSFSSTTIATVPLDTA